MLSYTENGPGPFAPGPQRWVLRRAGAIDRSGGHASQDRLQDAPVAIVVEFDGCIDAAHGGETRLLVFAMCGYANIVTRLLAVIDVDVEDFLTIES